MFLAWIRRAIVPVSLALGALSLDVLVDDTNSTIIYSPPDQWSQGTQCNGCDIHPDPGQTEDGTWHDSTYLASSNQPPRSISFSFTGTAVNVFNILPGIVPLAPTTHVDLVFTLDDVSDGSFTYDPADDSFQYRTVVFSAKNLENVLHTLVIQTQSDVSSVVLFDYIVYTIPDPPPPVISSSTTTSSTTVTSSASSSSLSSHSLSSSTSLSSSSPPLSPSQSSSSAVSQSITQSTSLPLSSTSSLPVTIQTPPSSLPAVHASSNGSGVQSSTGTPSNLPVPPTQHQGASTGSSVSKGALIGGAVGGGVLLLILLVALLYLLCKRRARRMTGTSGYAGPDEKLLPSRSAFSTSSSILVIGGMHPHSSLSSYSSSEADRTAASAGVTSTASPTSHDPASLTQDTIWEEKPPIPVAAENNTPRRLTLPATEPYAQGSPASPVADTRVFERLSAMQEEIARIRAHQAATAALLVGEVEAPPSYHEG